MEDKMKKVSGLLLCLLLTLIFSSPVLAAERIIKLNVPGCSSWNSNSRIRAILKKIDGVKKHANQGRDLLIITFDDEKTDPGEIIDELKKGNFRVNGGPTYIK